MSVHKLTLFVIKYIIIFLMYQKCLNYKRKFIVVYLLGKEAILLSSNWNCAQRLIGIRKAISKPLKTASNKSLKKIEKHLF